MSAGFRMRGALARHEMHFGPNMTPMVDVVMVILVFFMASTAFVGPEWFLRTALPAKPDEAEAPETDAGLSLRLPEARLTIRLYVRDGQTLVDGFGLRGATLDELADAIEASASELIVAGEPPSVVLEPGPGVAWGDVVRAHEACVAAGLTRVGL